MRQNYYREAVEYDRLDFFQIDLQRGNDNFNTFVKLQLSKDITS